MLAKLIDHIDERFAVVVARVDGPRDRDQRIRHRKRAIRCCFGVDALLDLFGFATM